MKEYYDKELQAKMKLCMHILICNKIFAINRETLLQTAAFKEQDLTSH